MSSRQAGDAVVKERRVRVSTTDRGDHATFDGLIYSASTRDANGARAVFVTSEKDVSAVARSSPESRR